jgi:aryl carrier-like protein
MYVAPRNHVEEHVSRLTAQLLRKSCIGVTDNLFDHGMDSLQVMELRLLLRKQFGAMPSLDDVYLNPTIQDLAKILRDKSARSADSAAGGRGLWKWLTSCGRRVTKSPGQ